MTLPLPTAPVITPEQAAQAARLRAAAQRLRAYAQRLHDEADRAAANAPGSFVTGRSGRSRAMNKRTERAMEKTIANAKKSLAATRKAAQLEAQAAEVELGHDEAWHWQQRQARREASQQAERREREAAKALPLTNDPTASWHMTSAEWARVGKDYKGISVDVSGRYRYRSAMRGGGLERVFLTDKKTVNKPA